MLNQRGSVQQSIMDRIIAASSDEINIRKTLDKVSGNKPGDKVATHSEEISSGSELVSESKQSLKRHREGDSNNTANKESNRLSETVVKKAKND